MSDEEQGQGAHITLKVDKSQQMKELEEKVKDLEEEKADLESKLTIVAEEKFNEKKEEIEAKGKRLGLDFDIENPSELKAFEKLVSKRPTKSSRNIPLTGKQLGLENSVDNENLPLSERSYETMDEMWADLDKEAKAGNVEAQNTLKKITKKELGELKNFDFEFEGKITDRDTKGKWRKERKLGV